MCAQHLHRRDDAPGSARADGLARPVPVFLKIAPDLDDAQERVRSGTSYAAIVIPADFTQDLLTITTANFTQPQLDYWLFVIQRGLVVLS